MLWRTKHPRIHVLLMAGLALGIIAVAISGVTVICSQGDQAPSVSQDPPDSTAVILSPSLTGDTPQGLEICIQSADAKKHKRKKKSWKCTCQKYSDANGRHIGEWSATVCALLQSKAILDAHRMCEKETSRVNCRIKTCGCDHPAKRYYCK